MKLPPPDYVASSIIGLPAKCPLTLNGQITAQLPVERIEFLRQNGPERKYNDSLCMIPVLENPTAIFKGLNRQNLEDCFCYSGLPEVRYVGDGQEEPPPLGMVFVVFVMPVGNDYQVLEWEWRNVSSTEVGHPADWNNVFARKLWPA